MFNKSNPPVATMGIDIGKNSFHVVGLDRRGAFFCPLEYARTYFAGISRASSKINVPGSSHSVAPRN